nr:MAG TPA: hypothetical protein [Caudoviricetes sp.]
MNISILYLKYRKLKLCLTFCISTCYQIFQRRCRSACCPPRRNSWLFKHMVNKYRISLPFSAIFENKISAYSCRFFHSVCKVIGCLLVLAKLFIY